MIQFAAGVVFGIFASAVAAMVAYCIYMEHKHPEIRDSYLAGRDRRGKT